MADHGSYFVTMHIGLNTRSIYKRRKEKKIKEHKFV